MKRHIMGICLLLSIQKALFGCPTCISMAEKNPKLPKNEVYVQLKKKDGKAQTRRRKGRKKKSCKTCGVKASAKKAE